MTVTVDQMARAWRARRSVRATRAQERARRLEGLLPHARRVLIDAHGAAQVTLFGSLAVGDCTEHSDVDLAVEGMPKEAHFDALADLMAVFGGPVDLVRLEDAPPSLVARIVAEGRRL